MKVKPDKNRVVIFDTTLRDNLHTLNTPPLSRFASIWPDDQALHAPPVLGRFGQGMDPAVEPPGEVGPHRSTCQIAELLEDGEWSAGFQ